MSDQTENTSIFNSQAPAENQAVNNEVSDHKDDYTSFLSEIKNERGEQKYKSIEDALYALKHSQEYIPELKNKAETVFREKDALEKKLQSLEETVFELTSRKEQPSTQGVQIDENAVTSLVEKALSQSQERQQAANNQKAVVETLNNKFGEKAEDMFYSRAKELGMTVEEVNSIAARSPKAALAILGVSESDVHKQSTYSPTKGTANTSNFSTPQETFIAREKTSTSIGATTEDIKEAVRRAEAMAEELRNQGLSTSYLEDPKNYFKHFK